MMRTLFISLTLLVCVNMAGQTITQCMASNDSQAGQGLVTCGFSTAADEASLVNFKAYIFDPDAGLVVESWISAKSPENFDLTTREALDSGYTYFVFAHGLTFGGKPPKAALTSNVKFSSTGTSGTQKTSFSTIVAADSKEKSDLYFAGQIWTVAGQDWNWAGSVDLKAQLPFRVGETRFDHQVGPFLTLQISNDPSADPDSFKYGVDWTARIVGIHGWFKGIYLKEEPRVESTRDFADQNVISDTRFTVELPSLVSRRKIFHGYVEPFLGVEAGKNLKAPLPQVDGTGRARPLAGISFALTFTKIPHLQGLGVTADLLRRWPLLAELGYTVDSNKMLRLATVGTAPKDRVSAKLNFMVKDWIGAFLGDEYGSEPPAFKLVDNKLTFGLLIQARFGSK